MRLLNALLNLLNVAVQKKMLFLFSCRHSKNQFKEMPFDIQHCSLRIKVKTLHLTLQNVTFLLF